MVKDKRYNIHPKKKDVLREREPPKSLRNQYQVINDTELKKSGKVNKINDNDIEVKAYTETKKKKTTEKPRRDIECPICKQGNCIEVDKGYYRPKYELIIEKQKQQ